MKQAATLATNYGESASSLNSLGSASNLNVPINMTGNSIATVNTTGTFSTGSISGFSDSANTMGSIGMQRGNALQLMSVPGIMSSLPTGSNSQAGFSTNWVITHEEKLKYTSLFKAWDTAGTGYLSGEQCRSIFETSGLPNNILLHIWSLADLHKAGKLNVDEFSIAMHLVYKKLNNVDLPTTLPDQLIPVAHKDLNSSVDHMKDQLLQKILADKVAAANAPSWVSNKSGKGSRKTSVDLTETTQTYVSKHRRKPQDEGSSSSTSGNSKVKQLRLELESLKQKVRESPAVLSYTHDDFETANKNHERVQRLNLKLRSCRDQYQASTGNRSASNKDIEIYIDRVIETKRKLMDLQLQIYKIRDRKKFKYPPIPSSSGVVNISSLISAASTPSNASPAMSDDERRKQKAAELLAQRMAALNVGGKSSEAHSQSLSEDQKNAVKRIEEEKQRLELEVKQLETSLRSRYADSANSSIKSQFDEKLKLIEILLNVEIPKPMATGSKIHSEVDKPFDNGGFDPKRRTEHGTGNVAIPKAPPFESKMLATHVDRQVAKINEAPESLIAPKPPIAQNLGSSGKKLPPLHSAEREKKDDGHQTNDMPNFPAGNVKSLASKLSSSLSSISGNIAGESSILSEKIFDNSQTQHRTTRDVGSAKTTESTSVFNSSSKESSPRPSEAVVNVLEMSKALGAQLQLQTDVVPSNPFLVDEVHHEVINQGSSTSKNSTNPFESPGVEGFHDPISENNLQSQKNEVVLYRASCLYDYTSGEAEDLVLHEGQEVDVYEIDGEWARGKLCSGSKAVGWFPKSYITPVQDLNESSSGKLNQYKGSYAKVLYDYVATQHDELSVKEGATVIILDVSDPDWWHVKCDKREGVVPATYLERM
jgi:hypothetical protein